MITVLLC